MREGLNVYCDACWAKILDAGYVDDTDLCETCLNSEDRAVRRLLGNRALLPVQASEGVVESVGPAASNE